MWREFWSWYFQARRFERAGRGRIYRLLGIRLFKYYLPTSGDLVSRWRGVSRITRGEGGLHDRLIRFENFTRTYEARHLFGGLSMLAISGWSIAVHGKGNWWTLLAANALINGYPILLQRYNRIRVQAALENLNRRPRAPRTR